jgi:dTDP-4-amino-4,6-dideoxygalactose transaminase
VAELLAIAKENQLTLLEDCAQAHGASVEGRRAGAWGTAGAFSFYPTKNLGALGDGGFITTSDHGVFERCLMMRNYGARMKDVHEVGGVNSRLDEVQAAMLRVKLEHLDEINEHRNRLALIYDAGLRSDFIRPVRRNGFVDVHHIYPIRHPERDRLRVYLEKKGIGTMVHYPTPLHRQKSLQEIVQGQEYPVAEEISNTILSLPISTAHRPGDIEWVIGVLNSF